MRCTAWDLVRRQPARSWAPDMKRLLLALLLVASTAFAQIGGGISSQQYSPANPLPISSGGTGGTSLPIPAPEIFVGGVDFTAGTSTTLTLVGTYRFVKIQFDAADQGSDTYTLVGNTVTFNAVIPVGVLKAYVLGFK